MIYWMIFFIVFSNVSSVFHFISWIYKYEIYVNVDYSCYSCYILIRDGLIIHISGNLKGFVLTDIAYSVGQNRVGFFIFAYFYSLCRQAMLLRKYQKITWMLLLQILSFHTTSLLNKLGRLLSCTWLNHVSIVSRFVFLCNILFL